MPPKRQRTTSESSMPAPKKTTAQVTADKALALARKIQRSQEKKALDFTGGAFTVGTTAVAGHLSIVGQGTAQNQRIGNSVYASAFAVNYYMYRHPTSVTVHMRFVIVMDSQTQGDDTSLAWTEVFDNASILAMKNRGSQRNRFTILYDKIHQMSASDIGFVHQKIFIKLNKTIEWNGSQSSDIQKNGIYLLALSDDDTNKPAMDYYFRLYFTDS